MRPRDVIFVGLVLGSGLMLGRGVLRSSPAPKDVEKADRPSVVALVDAEFRRSWSERGIEPAPPASDLAALRRLNLALVGKVPSLQEVRRFEALPSDRRIDEWVEILLNDRRSADYLAERFARAFVGVEEGPFIQFRRRRFASWLSDAILENRPYSEIVRELIAGRGLWTDHPATNFVSVTFDPMVEHPDPERLAARTARAFLGARIDCAQCHDHPFQPWTRDDFQGLAAFFGGVRSNLRGVNDGAVHYEPRDRRTKEPATVEPRPPSNPELLPAEGTPRQRLAGWIVDPRNPYFSRAVVNRVWALVFGRPLVEPIDDLLEADDPPAALEILADDFNAHGRDLRRLIRAIAATEVFRLDGDGDDARDHEETWAAFPMTRLRPDQVAASIHQAAALETIGPESPWIVRLITHGENNEFVKRYGDVGEDEFSPRSGTIPQRLLLMNGELIQKATEAGALTSPGRIARFAPDDAQAVELAYLAVLTRRPSPEETAHFTARLEGTCGDDRASRVADLFWTLFNSVEFSWNH